VLASVIAAATLSPCCTARCGHRAQSVFESGCGNRGHPQPLVDSSLGAFAAIHVWRCRGTACPFTAAHYETATGFCICAQGACGAAACEAGQVVDNGMVSIHAYERQCNERHRLWALVSSVTWLHRALGPAGTLQGGVQLTGQPELAALGGAWGNNLSAPYQRLVISGQADVGKTPKPNRQRQNSYQRKVGSETQRSWPEPITISLFPTPPMTG